LEARSFEAWEAGEVLARFAFLDFESDKTDDFGTEMIFFIALRNLSNASGPSFISA
jgi:hypothetical protein